MPSRKLLAWRGVLWRRYALTFVTVVALALLLHAGVSADLTYRHQRAALAQLQSAQADAAALRIVHFLREIELQLASLTALPWQPGTAEPRRLDALRVLRQTPAIADLVLLDGEGRERVAESRTELGRLDTLADRSASPAFAGAMARRHYQGDVVFRKGSEPFMTVAVAGPSAAEGVAIAEVSLKHIWDTVARIRIGEQGIAYVLDRAGRLIAHPDINLVLRNTDLSRVQQAFEAQPAGVLALAGTDGKAALASSVTVPPMGWRVVVEQPRQEADAALWAALRSGAWLAAASLLLALAAALWSAWRMTRPLRELTLSAERLGAGQLSHRIDLRTGDELQQLGDQFNAMAEQVQAGYQTLERKVEERTRELREANQAKSRLVSAASHDLRQPLHALNLLADQLRRETDPLERERLGGRLSAAISSIHAMFDTMLDVSKLDAGVLEPQWAQVPVQRILDQVDIAYSAAARAKGLELRIRPHDGWIRTDPMLLERIVGNLVANAIRYTREGGILVGCRPIGAGLRLAVWDTGIGLAPDKLGEIFEEFYQVPGAGVGRREGLGLGLSIVARLGELLGHEVSVRSRPGVGSCFRVDLPRVPAGLPGAGEPSAPIADALPGRRVLLIDNDAEVLDSTTRLLSQWGCRVDARARAPSNPQLDDCPDLLLLDMHLDDGDDGVAVAARLRAQFGKTIPALVVTGDPSPATQALIRAAGLPFLQKPVPAVRLRAALSGLVQRP